MKLYSVSLFVVLIAVAGCRSARMETAGGPRVSGPSQGFAGDTGVTNPPVVPRQDEPPVANDPAPIRPPPPNVTPGGLEPVPAPVGEPILPSRAGVKDHTRITCINGKYDPNHPTEIYVRPGEVLSLAADVFNKKGRAIHLPREAFAWTSSLGDECLGGSLDCLQHSSFQASTIGVFFYVPEQMGQSVRIVVESRDPRGRGTRDVLIVHNSDWDGRPRPSPVVVTDPGQYPGAALDPNVALNGMGRWVVIDNVRYFTPYTYELNGQPWAPYRNGYWARDNGGVVTWISYDPHGWVTGHYGVWRHHRQYGWIWLPFEDRRYEPHCVSWFNQGSYVGWYPYYQGYPQAYRHQLAQGFDDGFWLQGGVAAGFGTAGYAYNPGFAIVPANQIANVNVMNVMITGSVSFGVVQAGFRQPIARVPGAYFAPAVLPMTSVGYVTAAGGARIMYAQPVHPMPPQNAQFLQRIGSNKRPLPVGTSWQGANMVRPNQAQAQTPVVMNGNKVVGAAPVAGVDQPRTGLPVLRRDQLPQLKSGAETPPAAVAEAAPAKRTPPRKR